MFDSIKNKFNKERRQSKAYSEASSLDIPAIVEPRKSTSSTPTAYRSRYASMSSIPDSQLLSPPSSPTETRRSVSRGRGLSTSTARTSVSQMPAKSRGRKRHIFWGSSMWNASNDAPRGSVVRAKSSSVPLMHPEVAEERMKQMPHYHWRL